jgi:nicotinamide phosphoribosyltransferase
MKFNPALIADFYKISHAAQYPPKTEFVYSNTTPRSSRLEGVDEVVVFGLQYLVEEYLIKGWDNQFFARNKAVVIGEYKRIIDFTLGKDAVSTKNIEDLHDLGYLPLKIKALPEGSLCPIRVPFMTIVNTLPEFYWLTNFVETLTQTVIWQAITSATIAREYKSILTKYAAETSSMPDFVQWQAHDFSMRGMSSIETGSVSAAAHLLSFTGTDTITGVMFLEEYYGANVENELVGGSVSATEHAVMCAGGEDDERETFRRIIEDVYPSGIVSIVSDTWDFWAVLTEILPSLKDTIMKRAGKVVVRPDSGDPVKIITGYIVKEVNYSREEIKQMSGMTKYMAVWAEDYDCVLTSDGIYLTELGDELSKEEVSGAIQLLFDTFGGTVNDKGYIELDSHIGLIYGDSITLSRCEQICSRLKAKGFASTNVVFGVGSYTYQYNTRDTFSIACKATWVQIDGKDKPIFKDPKTDNGSKKSAKGLLQVYQDPNTNKFILKDECTREEESNGCLQTIFVDSKQLNKVSLSEVRNRLK